MSRIVLHTPYGPVDIDTGAVTDAELTALGLDRAALARLIPRDLAAEVDDLKTRVNKLEGK